MGRKGNRGGKRGGCSESGEHGQQAPSQQQQQPRRSQQQGRSQQQRSQQQPPQQQQQQQAGPSFGSGPGGDTEQYPDVLGRRGRGRWRHGQRGPWGDQGRHQHQGERLQPLQQDPPRPQHQQEPSLQPLQQGPCLQPLQQGPCLQPFQQGPCVHPLQQGPRVQPLQQGPPRPQHQQSQPLDTITSSMTQMTLSKGTNENGKKTLWEIPARKKQCDANNMVGTRGRKTMIEVNHLALKLKKLNEAYHYDCDFKPDVPKKLLKLAINQVRLECFPDRYPAFDGKKNLYSSGPLPFGEQIRHTVQVRDDERDESKKFDVTIKLVSKVDLSQISNFLNNGGSYPQDAIQALDIALRNPASMRFTSVGRSFFTRPQNETIKLGNGLELWYGFYQTAVLGWKPFLNVDVAHKGFPEPKPLLEVMLDMKAKYQRRHDSTPTLEQLAQQGLGRYELEDFNRFIRGLKVVYMIPNQPNTRRVYRMNGTKQPCISQRFMFDGRSITIGEYYDREKQYRLRYPKLPSIHVGAADREVCLPPELCEIMVGQAVNRKMDDTQTAAMVKAAARPPYERKRRIMDGMRDVGFSTNKCINEFGIEVSDKFERVPARVLDAPSLQYNNSQVSVDRGVWRAGRYLEAKDLSNWVVMTLSSRPMSGKLADFGRQMIQQGRVNGMKIAEPRIEVLAESHNLSRVNGDQLQRIVLSYFEQYKAEKVQLVVVVIQDQPPDSYSKVKKAAELVVGLQTQCVKEKTFNFKMNLATASNILHKINAKLNGINHVLSHVPSLMDEPVMIVGADVTHPSPDQTTIPSVAAVAASHDRCAFQYNMIWRLQPPREEIILDLEDIIKEQLLFFYKKTGQKPLKVMFYRDGVSEGQFKQVLEREMSAIRRACTSLEQDYQPKVTFLVVQKRHHIRFFPTRREDEDGKNKNVPPGTIVDTVITHNREMDFYLVSHASIQGTSRPTKYHKLWDENDIGEDDLEELTYYLCHLFSRCTRSVSYPAPTYYAHLAAARGRVYLEGARINLTNLDQEMKNRTIQDIVIKDSPMFFV